jgi:hypothetical protein
VFQGHRVWGELFGPKKKKKGEVTGIGQNYK